MPHALNYPLIFQPIFQERLWGGRNLEKHFGKKLPAGARIGESWEISDRPQAQSEVVNGPLAGRTLNELMGRHERELLGRARALKGRFPLLVKILDARETLSVQVHPPAGKAEALGGEAKTEMWWITHAEPGAELYAGLKRGTTKQDFEAAVGAGTTADLLHRVGMLPGDAMFLPSGRVHAIGAGLVLFEVQENSDTTYRVFDWNRRDAEGKARALHVRESLECIDFEDFEPAPIRAAAAGEVRSIVNHPLFTVERVRMERGEVKFALEAARVIGVARGSVRVGHAEHPVELRAGDFCLLPAAMGEAKIEAEISAGGAAEFLMAEPGW